MIKLKSGRLIKSGATGRLIKSGFGASDQIGGRLIKCTCPLPMGRLVNGEGVSDQSTPALSLPKAST